MLYEDFRGTITQVLIAEKKLNIRDENIVVHYKEKLLTMREDVCGSRTLTKNIIRKSLTLCWEIFWL